MDLKKEIKLSDLFKRKPKDTADETVAVDEEPKEKGSGLKREISFRRRKDKAPKEPKAAKEPKEKRAKGKAKDAPALPEVPLMRAFDLLPREGGKDEQEEEEAQLSGSQRR